MQVLLAYQHLSEQVRHHYQSQKCYLQLRLGLDDFASQNHQHQKQVAYCHQQVAFHLYFDYYRYFHPYCITLAFLPLMGIRIDRKCLINNSVLLSQFLVDITGVFVLIYVVLYVLLQVVPRVYQQEFVHDVARLYL